MDRALEICKEMLEQRGWNIDEKDSEQETQETQDNSDFSPISGTTNTGNTFMIFCLFDKKLNISNVKECINILTESETTSAIIIYPDDITSAAKKMLQGLHTMKIELFATSELQTNITKHVLVSQHQKLNQEEKADFIKRMGHDIPIIYKGDPVSRFYNFEKGDIVRVLRKDNTIGYRIVK